MLRPRLKLPLWSVLGLALGTYALRSIVLRGGDFTPDMPSDAIAGVALVVVVGVVAWARRRDGRD